jgi:hypothetical protein
VTEHYEAVVTKTPDDVIAVLRGGMNWRSLLGIALAAALAIGLVWLNEKRSPMGGFLAFGVLLTVFAMYLYVVIPNRARNIFLDQPSQAGPFRIVADNDGLSCSSERGTTTFLWNEFARWRDMDIAIVVYPNRYMNLIIPKRDLSNKMIEFMSKKLSENGLSGDGKGRLQ